MHERAGLADHLVCRITSADDPRLAPYARMRERDLVGRQGRFVAESAGVLRTLLSPASRFPVESVLIAQERLAPLAPLLEARLPPGVPLLVAPLALMAEVAGFPIHRGVLAIGRRGPEPAAIIPAAIIPPAITPAAPALVVALVGLTNHDNVGAVFRSAAAFGADAVLLDQATCDPLYRKAIRVSVGASLTVPFARFADADALLAAIEEADLAPLALTPGGAADLAGLVPPPRAALLLGTEGEGLPAAILARARGVRIAMVPGHDSLNVAAACAIALHHLAASALARGSIARDNARHLPPGGP